MGRRRPLAFVIAPDEWCLLSVEPAEVFLVYCQIRMYMDYKSCLSGHVHPFSEVGLCEVLEVESTRGRKGVRPSRQKLRSVIDRLVKIGVLVRRKDLGPLVFYHPFALADKSAKKNNNQTATKQQPEQQPCVDVDFCFENIPLSSYEGVNCNQTNAIGVSDQQPITESQNHRKAIDTALLDSARAGVDRDAVPRVSSDWFQFFINVLRFDYAKTRSAKMSVACEDWVRRGVSYGVVLDAVDVANGKCGGRPGSPVFYIGFVDDVLREGVRYEQRKSNASGGRGDGQGRLSAAERRRRDTFEYGRRRGLVTDEEWDQFKRDTGQPDKVDPFREGDVDAVAAHG